MKKVKILKNKKIFCFLLLIVFLFSVFSFSVSAFSYYPSTTSNTIMFIKDINTNQIMAYGYKVGGTSFTTTQYAYDISLCLVDVSNLRFVDLFDSSKYLIQKSSGDWVGNPEQYEIDHFRNNYESWKNDFYNKVVFDSSDINNPYAYTFYLIYDYYDYLMGLSNNLDYQNDITLLFSSVSSSLRNIDYDITSVRSVFSDYVNSSTLIVKEHFTEVGETVGYQFGYNNGYDEGYSSGYNSGQNDSTNYQQGYDTGYYDGLDDGYDDGYDVGYDSGYDVGHVAGSQTGYNTGYTQGAKDSKYMEDTLITIFSSPYYIFNEVFDFEIFGVDISNIIMVIISIVLVGFVLKVIL